MEDARTKVIWQLEIGATESAKLEEIIQEVGLGRDAFVEAAFGLLVWAVRHAKAGEVIAAVNEKDRIYHEVDADFLRHIAP